MNSDTKIVELNALSTELTDEGIEYTFNTEEEAKNNFDMMKQNDNVKLDGTKVISIMKKENRREV